MRCIHCLEEKTKTNDDHVFPNSWYPDTTPLNITKWKAPSCVECNTRLGKDEDFLFSRLALCTDPLNPATSGLANRALRIFGVNTKPLDQKERDIREKHRVKIVEEINSLTGDHQRIASTRKIAPDLGPPIPINGAVMERVYTKIVRGCEYVLGNKRYIEPPYTVVICDAKATVPFEEILKDVSAVTPLGPGFQIKRVPVIEDPLNVVYTITIWDTFKLYALVVDPAKMQ